MSCPPEWRQKEATVLKLNHKLFYLAIAVIALMAIAAAAIAQESEEADPSSSISLDLAYVTKYVWRGIPINEDPVVQPSLTYEHKSGLSLNLWGNIDTTDVADRKWDLTEIDYTLNYAWKCGGYEMTAGVGAYVFPGSDTPTTAEVYSSICFGGKLTPTLQVYYDFVKADGFYASLSTGYECGLSYSKAAPTLGLSAKLSYGTGNHNSYNYGVDTSGFTDLLLGAALPIKVGSKITVTPSINYATIINSDIRDAFETNNQDKNNFFAGITVSIPL